VFIKITILLTIILTCSTCQKRQRGFGNIDLSSYRGKTVETLLNDIGIAYEYEAPEEESPGVLQYWSFRYLGRVLMRVVVKDFKYCVEHDNYGSWKLEDFKKESIWCIRLSVCY
jgi:hypothetical protein